MLVYDMEQGSAEWFAIRKGKMGASHAGAIAAAGKGLDTYIMDVMEDCYKQTSEKGYTNADMERGNNLEAQARAMYELETGNEVEQVGWVEHNEYWGCSPDGMVDQDGNVEIKCPNDKKYFKYMIDGEIEKGYFWQMQMQMLVCEREWCDYVVYNPNFNKSIIIQRVLKDAKSIEKLIQGLELGAVKIETIRRKING